MGGTNSLELQAGWQLLGNIVASGGSNTLVLGGNTTDLVADPSGTSVSTIFNVSQLGSKYQGFQNFEKTGASTWRLTGTSSAITPWTISEGTLQISSDGALGATSGMLTLRNNATLATTASFTTNRQVTLGAAGGNVDVQNSTTLGLTGVISGSGALTKSGGGSLTLSGSNTYTGGTNIEAGNLYATSGSALGSGTVNNNATLNLSFAVDSTMANILSGPGMLQKIGNGTATLTGAGSSAGSVIVQAGALSLAQTGVFTAGSYTTGLGATTTIGGASQLAVTGNFTQTAGSTLNVVVGANEPVVSAATATIGGALNITGFSADMPSSASELSGAQFTIIHTTGGITGDFNPVDLGGVSSPVDYLQVSGSKSADDLDYNVGFGLTWLAGPVSGDGVFTLADATDAFDVDVVLSNQTPSATGWNGSDLTKNGEGTLTLSAANTFTGQTVINGGTLVTGIDDAFASSSAVTVKSGATLALNDFSQLANNLSGGGSIALGTATLTANNTSATEFAGVISGSGALTKSGGGSLTLSGSNTYTGGTNIEAGNLYATSGSALGSGTVNNNATLNLSFAVDSTMANILSGPGMLQKIGNGTATLTGAGSSAGSVIVQAGALSLAQTGVFTAGSYTTGLGATTTIGGASQLAVTGNFTQTAGSTLNVVVGANEPVVSAATATIGGALNITGFSADMPSSASELSGAQFTIIHTTGGITGDFNPVDLGGVSSPVDYLQVSGSKSADDLDYNVGFGLTWLAGPVSGDGVFTLADATDAFDVDVVLSNQTPSATGWNGSDLTKNGEGTLTLSAANTFTGQTVINGGTLVTGIDDAFASSSAVTVKSGATLALNDFSQLANNLSGGGSIALGTATLTANNTAATEFAGVISGSGALTKSGGGSLTLSGSNTYTGGTNIEAGTLQLGKGGTTGNVVGNIVNNAVLVFNRSDRFQIDGSISGLGSVNQIGSGVTVLGGANSYTGPTNVLSGGLHASAPNTFSPNSKIMVAGAGTLSLAGYVQRVSGIENAGSIVFGDSPTTTLTVNGNYIGNDGIIFLNTFLGSDNSPSDMLVIDSGTASGSTTLVVRNADGPGAKTLFDGIRVVDAVNGATTAAGAFTLAGDYETEDGQQAVVAGAYAYTLHHNGITDPTDNDWYLRSRLIDGEEEGPRYGANVPVAEAYPQVLQALNDLPTLQQRVGNRYWKETPPPAEPVFCKDPAQNFRCAPSVEQSAVYADGGTNHTVDGNGVWGRIEGAHSRFRPAVTTSSTGYDVDIYRMQAGLDGLLHEGEGGRLIGGLTAHYVHGKADVTSFFGDGEISTDGYGFGGTLTWYGNNGFYLDAQAQATWYDSNLLSLADAMTRPVLTDGDDGFGYALSLEGGKRIELDNGWLVTPQAQLAWSSVDFDSYTDPFGSRVSLEDGDSLRGRLGLSIERQQSFTASNGKVARTHVYGIANLYGEFLDGSRVNVAGVSFDSRNERIWGGIGLGGSYNWNDDKYSVYGEGSIDTSLQNFADSYTLKGTVGFKVKF
ncbi:autotransporter outer membrane beta-barrel domain-containing protein [Brucella intermedia]|nr:autotransporter outer membrane beta-barrel domain-containing protein [Brucella intermedia]